MSCEYFCCLSAVILLFVVYKFIDWLLRLPTVGRHADRCVFITGCDTGFGNDLAKRLDSRGCHVFAGCLTEKGETELRKVCSERLVTVSLDVTKPESVRKAYGSVSDKLEDDGKVLWAVINNAGIGCPVGPPEWQTVDDYRDTAAVNLYGLIDVTMTFLPLVKKSRGRVVNMASIAGRSSFFGITPYSVSKYGVEAFTDGLRRSLRPYGCKASLIEPAFYNTNLASGKLFQELIEKAWNRAPAETKEEFGTAYFDHMMEAVPRTIKQLLSDKISEVTDAYEHAVLGRFPRARYPVGLPCSLIWLPIQALPEWIGDWILDLGDWNRPLPAVLR